MKRLLRVITIVGCVLVPSMVAVSWGEGLLGRSGAAGGICTDLGCIGGLTKCADGKIIQPNGVIIEFTCYTTIDDQ